MIAIDKPAGWMLAPDSWQHTGRNLQVALVSSMRAGAFWARARGLKFLRFIHRLDSDTSGILLLAKSSGALSALGRLFEGRAVQKVYWAVVEGVPGRCEWSCHLKLGAEPDQKGRVRVDATHGKSADTRFRVLQPGLGQALVEACPLTGRTHQIRLHLAAGGHPVLGDPLYGTGGADRQKILALRAVEVGYRDPFTRRHVQIRAPVDEFVRRYGFDARGVI